jgi:hypothetical protein
LTRVRGGRHLAGRVVLEGRAAVGGTLRHGPAERVVGPGIPVDLSTGRVLDVLPFGEPTGGVIQGGRRRDDLRPGQIGCAGEAGAFSSQVVGEVDPLRGDEPGGPLLLLGDLCQFAPGDTDVSPEELRKALPERRLRTRCQAFRQRVAPAFPAEKTIGIMTWRTSVPTICR